MILKVNKKILSCPLLRNLRFESCWKSSFLHPNFPLLLDSREDLLRGVGGSKSISDSVAYGIAYRGNGRITGSLTRLFGAKGSFGIRHVHGI